MLSPERTFPYSHLHDIHSYVLMFTFTLHGIFLSNSLYGTVYAIKLVVHIFTLHTNLLLFYRAISTAFYIVTETSIMLAIHTKFSVFFPKIE